MATFVLIHGGGDVGWYWHLVETELRRLGHDVVAPDLPCDDDSAGLVEYADAVIDAIGDRADLVVVGQSYGGFTAPLVADRVSVDVLVLVAGMIPAPGETPAEWWDNTGYADAVQDQARRDGGLTGSDDPFVAFYHDVPRALAEEALRKERSESSTAYHSPWPLDAWPAVPTRFVLCSEDRFFPPEFMRRVVADRLAITPDEIDASHCVALSRPTELARMLVGYRTECHRTRTPNDGPSSDQPAPERQLGRGSSPGVELQRSVGSRRRTPTMRARGSKHPRWTGRFGTSPTRRKGTVLPVRCAGAA